MINRTVLVGRLTKDVELKQTGNGVSVASFTLAVNRAFKNANGEREADFINCVMWRKSAENFAQFTHKGSLVGIEGRIQTRSYDNQDGQRVFITEVVADNFSLLDPKNSTSNQFFNGGGTNTQQRPQNVNKTYSDPFNSNEPIEINDDDLPF